MQRGLLGRRWESPRRLGAAFLAEFEAHLARRAQSFRMIGAEGHAGVVKLQRAEHPGTEEAVVA